MIRFSEAAATEPSSTTLKAQPLALELVEHCLHERGLSRAAGTGQERVVGGSALDELEGVLLDQRFLAVDAAEVGQADAVQVRNRLDETAAGGLAPAECDARLPVDRRRRGRKQCLDALEQRFTALDQPFQFGHRSSSAGKAPL